MSKEKIQQTPPPLGAPNRTDSIAMGFRFNPQLDAKLDKFMADNPEMTEYFTKLVKEHPERAIRTFAMRSMFRQENQALKNTVQMSQVKEWVDQYPGLEEKITSNIRTKNPITAAASFIRQAMGLKRSVEMTAPRNGVGASL